MRNRSARTATDQRVVRVFVSSTFRDMQGERDELVKRIFPQLRKLCEQRGVTWGEVDLRWGITEEQSERGEVLPICLAEIQRCRPYFIGLLGERYGWIPDVIPTELIERQPWLKQHLHRSVTELEILHGVLNDPDMADHAFFYLRDRAFIDSNPSPLSDLLEIPSTEEIASLGQMEAEGRAAERRDKLAALKTRIRGSGLPVRENYSTPGALGKLVLRDLTEIIERLYPVDQVPDPLDREALDQESFAESRARVYIGRQSYYDQLAHHAQSDELPLVVVGESGSGKSALLSNWALRYRRSQPDQLLVMHFIGATPQSADWAAMVRRVMGELKRSLNLKQAIPDQNDALGPAFAEFLDAAAAKGGAVLIFDALNQLEDRDAAPDLAWLPHEIPRDIRLMLSTLPGRPLEELKRRGWPSMTVEPLEADERRELIQSYLAQYGKHLSAQRLDPIVSAGQTANPLYLRALLDELVVFGVHEELDVRINHYLAAKTPDKLYQKILARYEQDYERERPGLVRDAMSILWAARRGLSETEIMELLGSAQQSLPRAYWSPLYLAAEQSLVSRSGLITFSHDFLRQAVRNKYLRTKRQQEKIHLRLADYFDAQPLGRRKIEELPWQLVEARAWQRVSALLSDREFFVEASEANQFDVSAYWARIEEGSSLRMVEAYRRWLDEGFEAEGLQTLGYIYALHSRAGHEQQAKAFYSKYAEHINEIIEYIRMPVPGLQGDALLNEGRVDEAMELYKEQERICRELGNDLTLQLMLGVQASILISRGAFDEAMRLSIEREEICRALGEKSGLERSLGHQAFIWKARGEFDEAIRLVKEQERICRDSNDQEDLQQSLANQADILRAKGDLNKAIKVYKEQELICREFGYKEQLQNNLGNQAVLLSTMDRPDESMRLCKEQESICRELGNKNGLQQTLGNQAVLLRARRQFDEAQRLLEEQERICRELGSHQGLAYSLINQALLLSDERGRPREALPLAESAYDLARQANLILVAEQIRPLVDQVRAKATQSLPVPVYVSIPHPGADADRATQLNLEYQQELARWNSLPWWKRLKEKKPERPRGI